MAEGRTIRVATGAPRPAMASIPVRALVRLIRFLRQNGALLIMALPGVIVVFLVSYMPMPGIVLAFKDYKAALGVWGSPWVGLRNFQFLFNSGIAWEIIRNTVVLNAAFIVAGQVCAA